MYSNTAFFFTGSNHSLVKVKKDWRDSDILLKNFGYNPKDIEMGE